MRTHLVSPMVTVFVDVRAEGEELQVDWPGRGHTSQAIAPAIRDGIRQQLDRLAAAERAKSADRARVPALRSELGETLFETLDGPKRALALILAEHSTPSCRLAAVSPFVSIP